MKIELLSIIENVQNQNLEAIDTSKLGDVLSWKVAFLYQNRENPVVAPIYAARSLKETHTSFTANTPLSQCHKMLLSQRGNKNIFEYADELLEYAEDTDGDNDETVHTPLSIAKSMSNYPCLLYTSPSPRD